MTHGREQSPEEGEAARRGASDQRFVRQSEAQMSRRSRSRNIYVARAAAPVLSVIAGSVLVSLPSARADAIWSDSSGDWNVSSNWLSTNGTVLPPGTGVVATPNTGPITFIGNGGSVSFGGPDVGVNRFDIGYSAGRDFAGTGALTMTAGAINTDQDHVIGDGATGTLNVAGGSFYTKDTKHTFVGVTADGTVNLTAGNIYLSRYGFESGGGVGTLNMSGGNLEFRAFDGTLIDTS